MRMFPAAMLSCFAITLLLGCNPGNGGTGEESAADHSDQTQATEETTEVVEAPTCENAGPQSPRDIHLVDGINPVMFSEAPPLSEMNLCDIHFHRFAEHKAEGYSTLAGEGDHQGYICNGTTPGERPAASETGCKGIALGDTVEVHWAFTTCDVEPGPGLGSCFSNVCSNPDIRVVGRTFNLTDAADALDFASISNPAALILPEAENEVEYRGSSTGSSFSNDSCSPFSINWMVGPQCQPLNIASLNAWCDENVFDEDKAHTVRKLVTPLELLSKIE